LSVAGAAPDASAVGARPEGAGADDNTPGDARVITEVGVAHAASHFAQLALPPLFPALRDEFGMSWAQLGLLMTVFYAVSCVGQAACGFLVDRHGPRRALAAGFTLLSLGLVFASVSVGPLSLGVAVGLIALGNAVFHPADFSTLNRRVSTSRLGHAFALHAVAGNLGYALAPVAMVGVAAAAGWRGALVAAAVLIAVAGLGLLRPAGVFGGGRVIEASPSPGSARPAAFAFLTPALRACMVFFVTINIAMIGLQSFGTALLQSAWGYGAASAAAWLTAFIVAAAAGMLCGGFVASATRRHEHVAAAGTLTAAMLVALLAAGAVPSQAAGVLTCAAGFAIGLVAPSRDMLVRAATPPGATGRAFGIVYAGVDVGAALGPVLVGAWLDRGAPSAAYATVALALVATAAVGLMIGRLSRTPTPLESLSQEPPR
jgi:MFS family permease